MEGLILAIIIAIVSSLFSGKNKKKEQQSMPPFNNKPNEKPVQSTIQPEQQSKPKTLEDFAKGIFEQLNEQQPFSDLAGKQQPKVETTKSEPIVEIEKGSNKRKPLSENRSTRQSEEKMTPTTAPKPVIHDVIKENEIGQFIPNSREALIQAVITSEIIGLPKSKQRS